MAAMAVEYSRPRLALAVMDPCAAIATSHQIAVAAAGSVQGLQRWMRPGQREWCCSAWATVSVRAKNASDLQTGLRDSFAAAAAAKDGLLPLAQAAQEVVVDPMSLLAAAVVVAAAIGAEP